MIQRIKAITRNRADRLQMAALALVPLLLILATTGTVLAQDVGTASRDSLTERILTLAETRPVAQIIVFILMGLVLYSGGLLIQSLRQRYSVPWRATVRLAGWVIPLITTLLVIVFVLGNEKDAQFGRTITVSFIHLIIPVAAAVHTALIFSPEDEPLEMLLALPRPITWLVFERLLIIVLIYAGIGVMGMGLMSAQGKLVNAGALLAAWVPPLLFLASFSLYLTVRTRVMLMGLIGALLVWFIFMLFNPFLMPGMPQPFPMNYVQPFLWTVNIFAQPYVFPEAEYYPLNRLTLLGLSVFWLWRTVAQLNDSETLLLTLQDRQTRRRAVPAAEAPKTKRPLRLNPAPVAINVLWQIAAMCLYETKLHWRRRPLKVVFLTLVLTTGIALLIAYNSLMKVSLAGGEITQLPLDQQMMLKGLAFMRMSMSIFTVVQMLILPVILADSVALDEADHMRDMLHSTPLPGWAYLAGKIGGMWWASMSAITFATVSLCIIWLFVVGVYNPLPILDSWIVFSAPIVLFNGGFALLIGATQPNRRRAVLIVMGAFFVSFYLAGPAMGDRFTALNPYNNSLLMNIFSQMGTDPMTYTPIFTLSGVTDFVTGRALVFVITALIVGTWWTLRWSGLSLWSKTSSAPAPLPVQQGS
jgi:ABC-type transport system involved in multi-copper enzyme maturation permease subunit